MSERVLLIEDSAAMARVMRLALAGSGYDVEISATRDDALRSIETECPEAVVMDYIMPGMPPVEFIHRARTLGFAGPILVCTGMDSRVELAVDDVIEKPFDPDDLARRVDAVLSKHRGAA